MTYEFTNDDWQQTNDGFLLMIASAMPYEEKPLIQVYFYPTENHDFNAVLIEPRQIQYIHATNMISVHSKDTFAGYIVTR